MMNPNFVNYNNQIQQLMQQQLMQMQQIIQQQQQQPHQEMLNHQFQQYFPKQENITLYFVNPKSSQPPIPIECSMKDKISEVIKKYKEKTKYKIEEDQNEKFIFNCMTLSQSKTVEESNLTHNSKIFVVINQNIG